MVLRRSKKLSEITNTPKTYKTHVEEPETCYVTRDEDILDLKIQKSDDDIFEDIKIDMQELKFLQ